jgi:Annexin
LIEVLGYTSNEEFTKISDAYQKRYKADMKHDVLKDVSAVEKKFYTRLFSGARDETNEKYNMEQDVLLMNTCRQGKKGEEQDIICEIFTTRGFSYLPKLFTAYEIKYRQSIHKFICKDFSGRMEDTLVAFGINIWFI